MVGSIFHSCENRMTSGTLVAFEGIDATGKTTLISDVTDLLERDGCDVTVVDEFSDSTLGENLQETLVEGNTLELDGQELSIASKAIADYFYQVENEIRPPLQQGQVVLVDRYVDTLPVYDLTHVVNATDDHEAAEMLFDAVERLTPHEADLTVLLTLPPEVHYERVTARGDEPTQRDRRLYEKRDEHYRRRLAERDGETFVYDTDTGVDRAARDIVDVIRSLLG